MKYNKTKVTLRLDKYINNDNLCIILDCDEGIYGLLTKNFDHTLDEDMAYVDINNFPEAPKFIEKYKLGVPTGFYIGSGFCEYPLYIFDIEEVKKYA